MSRRRLVLLTWRRSASVKWSVPAHSLNVRAHQKLLDFLSASTTTPTANMPKDVKEKSGLIVGLNRGHSTLTLPPSPKLAQSCDENGSTEIANSTHRGHPKDPRSQNLEEEGLPFQAHCLRQGDHPRSRWVRYACQTPQTRNARSTQICGLGSNTLD
jgi:hypothetical protein